MQPSATLIFLGMATDDRTDRFRPVFEPEEIFDRFVKNANATTDRRRPRDDEPTGVVESGETRPARGGPPSWDHEVTVRTPRPGLAPQPPSSGAAREAAELDAVPDDEEDLTVVRRDAMTESGQRIVLLTRPKKAIASPPPLPERRSPSWESVVAERGPNTQQIEAARVVPDVGALARQGETTLSEGVEDGQIPTRQLDQILGDMGVLLRYGHAGQVRDRLEQLRRTYPEDLLLLRRIAEFHVEHGDEEAALETLFALAGGLFERRNVEGMRQALEQVLVLQPENARAYRLLGLLEQRPKTGE